MVRYTYAARQPKMSVVKKAVGTVIVVRATRWLVSDRKRKQQSVTTHAGTPFLTMRDDLRRREVR